MPDVYDSVGGGENVQSGENMQKKAFLGFGTNPAKLQADFTATTTANEKTKMTLKVNTGTQLEPVYKNRILNNVNPLASNTDFLAIGTGLGGLQTHTLVSVNRTNSFDLLEE